MLARIGIILGIAASIATILGFLFGGSSPPTPPSPPVGSGSAAIGGSLPSPYPAQVQQQWLNDCEQRNNTSVSFCQCELSYFEQHASYQVFEQEYGNSNPGVPPAQLANVSSSCGSNL
jgi:hypothetical protein